MWYKPNVHNNLPVIWFSSLNRVGFFSPAALPLNWEGASVEIQRGWRLESPLDERARVSGSESECVCMCMCVWVCVCLCVSVMEREIGVGVGVMCHVLHVGMHFRRRRRRSTLTLNVVETPTEAQLTSASSATNRWVVAPTFRIKSWLLTIVCGLAKL